VGKNASHVLYNAIIDKTANLGLRNKHIVTVQVKVAVIFAWRYLVYVLCRHLNIILEKESTMYIAVYRYISCCSGAPIFTNDCETNFIHKISYANAKKLRYFMYTLASRYYFALAVRLCLSYCLT
jgi:hypothetical protein